MKTIEKYESWIWILVICTLIKWMLVDKGVDFYTTQAQIKANSRYEKKEMQFLTQNPKEGLHHLERLSLDPTDIEIKAVSEGAQVKITYLQVQSNG